METRLAELHIQKARDYALELVQIAQATIPKHWEKLYTEKASVLLSEFAFHARRVNELCSIPKTADANAHITLFVLTPSPPLPLMTDYRYALDRIVHSKTYRVSYVHTDDRKIFHEEDENLALSHVNISTDRKLDEQSISVWGLAIAFLNTTIPYVKANHPDLIF